MLSVPAVEVVGCDPLSATIAEPSEIFPQSTVVDEGGGRLELRLQRIRNCADPCP